MLERVLDRDRLRRSIRNNWILVDTAGKFVQARSVVPKFVLEGGQFQAPQFPNGLDCEISKLLSRDFADSRQTPNRQWQKKPIDLLGLDNKESIRFPPVRGELRQELVGRHTRRGGQT